MDTVAVLIDLARQLHRTTTELGGMGRGHTDSFLRPITSTQVSGEAGDGHKAVRAAAPVGEAESAGRLECCWQREQLPEAIRELVLDDQRLRNEICWSVFEG